MSFAMTVLYGRPDDESAFDAHYEQVHAPLAAQMPGLVSYTAFHPATGPDGVVPETYLVAALTFPDVETFLAATHSEQGRAAIADVEGFATGGVTILTGPVSTYV